MAYASWSVVFGEQPSAAKWNILGTNDASFNDGTGIATAAITSLKLSTTIACRAYRNAAATVTGGGGADKISLDATSYNIGSYFDTANGRFVAPVTGYYQVNASVRLAAVNTNGIVAIHIYANGASYCNNNTGGTVNAQEFGAVITDVVYVSAGQYIELYADCSTTESVTTGTGSTFMSIHYIGA